MKVLIAAIVVAGMLALLWAAPAEAQLWNPCPDGVSGSSAICGDESEATDVVGRLINVFLFVIGALSVIMIVHSGLKYTTSRGDPEQIKSAKNTLLYAVTGVIVALLAYSIVNFVVGAFGQPSADDSRREAEEGQQINPQNNRNDE